MSKSPESYQASIVYIGLNTLCFQVPKECLTKFWTLNDSSHPEFQNPSQILHEKAW